MISSDDRSRLYDIAEALPFISGQQLLTIHTTARWLTRKKGLTVRACLAAELYCISLDERVSTQDLKTLVSALKIRIKDAK